MIPEWIIDNWEGITIEVFEPLTESTHFVPGWRCRHCDGEVGCSGEPPKHCPHCGFVVSPKGREK